jgi:hypothetical protein
MACPPGGCVAPVTARLLAEATANAIAAVDGRGIRRTAAEQFDRLLRYHAKHEVMCCGVFTAWKANAYG